MKKDILIGIDIGSSNVKTVMFDKNYNLLASEAQEYPTIVPKPGWTEYNPEDWWNCVKLTLKRVFAKTMIEPTRIAGLGVSSLGCCPVPMNEAGEIVYNGIPWSDQRAQEEVGFLIKVLGDKIFDICKNFPTTMNCTPHLMWIKNHEPEIYKKIYKFSEPSGFLAQKFTGEFALDLSFASATVFGFNMHKIDWDVELIKSMGLDKEIFPRLHKNTECIGYINKKAAKDTGLAEGIPVYSGGPDLTAGALAAGVLYSGQGFYSMGSGANIIAITDNPEVKSRYLIGWFHAKGSELRMMDGVQGSIGYSLRWFRDQFCGLEQKASELLNKNISDFQILDLEASTVKPGSGGIVYIPYLFGKFHPILNPKAKAAFFGLSPNTNKSHLIKAVMEGCCYDMYESFKNLQELGLKPREIVVTGGPSKSNTWCQALADVTNIPFKTVIAPEASPFGDAILAGVGSGLFNSLDEVIEDAIKVDKIFTPNEKNHAIYKELFELYLSIYQSSIKNYDKLLEIIEKHSL